LENIMTTTRRTVINGGMALATAGALTGPALLEWAKAWAQTTPWRPERGAQLSLLRPKSFVRAEDEAFIAAMDAFTKSTGVKISITRESNDDVQPKASVAASIGAGPDLFWGFYSLPHLFSNKCLDVTDVADYLGKKYGAGRQVPSCTEKTPETNGSTFPSVMAERSSTIEYHH
jgi:multiple sugar transport system substrate-binding protein